MKKLWPLTALFVILAIAGVVKIASKKAPEGLEAEAGLENLPAAAFTAADVARVEIALGTGASTAEGKPPRAALVRSGDAWTIETYHNAPGDADKIKGFLEKLAALQGELRARDAAVHADFGLDADKAVHLRLTGNGGKALLHLLAGKKGRYNTCFVRRDGDNAVHEVNVNIRSEIGLYGDDAKELTQNHWLDRVAVKLEKDRMKKVALVWPDRTLTLEKKTVPPPPGPDGKPAPDAKPTTQWEVTDGAMGLEYKASATDTLLGALSKWDVNDVTDPAKAAEAGLGEAAPYRCDVTLEDGRTVSFRGALGANEGDRLLTVSTREKTVYGLSSYQFERVFMRGDQLFTLPPLGIEKDKLAKVVTRDAGGERTFEKGADGKWKLAAPDTGHTVKESAVEDVPAGVAALAAVDVAAEGDRAARGLEPGDRVVTCTFADGKSRVLKFGKTPKGAAGPYALLDPEKPLTTVVSKYNADRVFPEWTTLVEAKVFPGLEGSAVTELAVKGSADELSARKADGKWTLKTKDGEGEGKADAIEAWANRLAGLQADTLSHEAEPQGKVVAEVVIKPATGDALTLKVGEAVDGKRAVWRADRRLKFMVPDGTPSAVIPDAASLKPAPPPPPPEPPKAPEAPKPEGDAPPAEKKP